MLTLARGFEKRVSWGLGCWLLAISCLVLTVGGCGSNAALLEDFTFTATPGTVALTAGGSTQQVTLTSPGARTPDDAPRWLSTDPDKITDITR